MYIGEYAAKGYTSDDGVKRSNDLISALSEAAFLTGIERNSDIVKMASYAPLFSRSRPYSQWGPDMIFFNDTSLYKTPNYFVQKMCSNNMGDYTLKTEISQPTNQRIYQTTSYDESAKEIIVKLVNPSDVDQLVVMNIDASFNLTGKMTTNLLTSNLATDFNDFDNTNQSCR